VERGHCTIEQPALACLQSSWFLLTLYRGLGTGQRQSQSQNGGFLCLLGV
jgi:hypothetical protein